MALKLLMMSQTATPHKLLNDLLCKYSIVSMLFFCNEQLCTNLCVYNVAVPQEGKLSEYFLSFVLQRCCQTGAESDKSVSVLRRDAYTLALFFIRTSHSNVIYIN